MRPTATACDYSRWLLQHPEEEEGAMNAQPTPGGGGEGGDTEAKVRQQKSNNRDATLDLLLKYLDATLATYV
jgi:hypothetical protein